MKSNNNNLLNVVVVGIALIGASTFASGFRCEGEMGYAVKLFNHTSGATRTPSVMVVSQQGEGTLLRRSDDEISKTNRANTVRYTVEGNRKIDADTAILQISFKEGRETISEGESVDGQLILVKDGDRSVFHLVCERYLKAE